MFSSLFDLEDRIEKIDKQGDPLTVLNESIDWEIFRADLEVVHQKERKSSAGRRPYDVILMFKILVLQSLYNLSDDAMEYQILDRLSFMRFLGLGIDSRVPDAKTIWLFRERIKEHGLDEALFTRFNAFLDDQGFVARKGQIVDASLVKAPRQRNSRSENERIRKGEQVEEWSEAKRCQKDTNATWTKKGGETFFGYKNHVSVDNEFKFIRTHGVTTASVHDSQMIEKLLDPWNTSADVWADSAYRSKEIEAMLEERGYRSRIHRKGVRGRALAERERQGNKTRSRVRARVEHVFGFQKMAAGDLVVRTIGAARAKVKIGLRNITYNLARYARLATA